MEVGLKEDNNIMKIDLEAYVYQLTKQATDAIYGGRNKAYAKGMRDAIKIAESFAEPGHKVKPVVQKITSSKTGNLIEYTLCGNCKTWVLEKEALFCGHCGQEIDWPEHE